MKVNLALVVVVAVLWLSTVECDEAIDSKEICEQIRSNQLRILTMGGRGKSLDDAHFYILVEGGYMFKVPLTNLRVHAENRTTSITIDRDIILADAWFNVSRDLFTQKYRFFFISNQNQDAFLSRMRFSSEQTLPILSFQLFDLNGALSIRNNSQDIQGKFYKQILVMSSIGIDSNTTYGFELINKKLFLLNAFEVHSNDELKLTDNYNYDLTSCVHWDHCCSVWFRNLLLRWHEKRKGQTTRSKEERQTKHVLLIIIIIRLIECQFFESQLVEHLQWYKLFQCKLKCIYTNLQSYNNKFHFHGQQRIECPAVSQEQHHQFAQSKQVKTSKDDGQNEEL